MMRRILLAVLVPCVIAQSAVESASCVRDDLFSSLSEDGRRFCVSMLNSHCATLVTPTQWVMYEATDISSQCECVLTEREGASFTRTVSQSQTSTVRAISSTATSSTSTIRGRPGQLPSTYSLSTFTTLRSAEPSEGGTRTSTSSNSTARTTSGLSPTSLGTGISGLPTSRGTAVSFVFTDAEPSLSGWNSTLVIPGSGAVTGTVSFVRPTSFALPSTSGAANSSSTGNETATSTPTFLTPTNGNMTATATTVPVSGVPVVNFTQVTRTAHIAEETCYHLLPVDGEPSRRALLFNSKLREADAAIPYPYIESIDFDSQGLDPLFLTVRDISEGTHMIDVSNKSRIAIVDLDGNAMVLDPDGIHFSTDQCRFDVSILMDNMYQQLANVSGKQCSTRVFAGLMEDADFSQTLFLSDQCGAPVGRAVRRFPRLSLGDTDCVESQVDEASGQWDFDCTFPGFDSQILQCQRALQDNVVDFLFRDPFGDACPDLTSVITTLAATGESYFDAESLRTELRNQGLNSSEEAGAEEAVQSYTQLWVILQQALSTIEPGRGRQSSSLEDYVSVYNDNRSLENDVCENLHADEIPLRLSLMAGVSHIDPITTLNWSPESGRPYNITIQDPSAMACCSAGSVAETDDNNTCAYPQDALIGDSGCVCGLTVGGAAVAFEVTQCDNFVSTCEADGDCADAGHDTFVCLVGSCCGGGVCVDPYECSREGKSLLEG